ncbi:MAG: flagellar hook protein FlgE [Deltaproteobacteria bacterium]|nr:flagellar hook protein FlgE [Deltaproteobacteria bacterium]
MATIIEGLFAGRAGIQSHGAAISVLADNIANANTVGYKTSRGEFVDLLAGNLGGAGSSTAVGSGSSVKKVTQLFTQGSFEYTGRGLDVGIDGNGFFILEDSSSTRFYSRAGNLSVDSEGNVRNQNGLSVLGFPANGSGGLEALNVNEVSATTTPTTTASITGNLNSAATITTVPDPLTNPTWAQVNAAATFSTFVDVFDSLGESHTISVMFFKTDAGEWTVNAYVDGGETTGGQAGGLPEEVGRGTITFGSDGLRPDPIPAVDFTAAMTWANGSQASSIDFGFNPFTQFSTPSNISSIVQNGSGSGSVTAFNIEKDGTLFALLDNGQTASVGKIALAIFANPEGMRRAGESKYIESIESGQPVVGTPATGRFGTLASGALELSTSDIASDFIKLISYQRGFQGSSRIVTKIDDLLNEIMSLAR